jgi:hypothetical protein
MNTLVFVFTGITLVFWLKVVMVIEQLHGRGGDRRLVEERGNYCLLCLLPRVLAHLFLWCHDSIHVTLSVKWAAAEK